MIDEEDERPADTSGAPDRPLFPHPDWTVGVVLIFGVVAVVAGFSNPVWWLIGSPVILALVIFLGVRVRSLIDRE